MKNAFDIVKDFEYAIADYTGSPYVVAVNSCTNALFLCLQYHRANFPRHMQSINIPKRTYVSVPSQIKNAGYEVSFRDEDWLGAYRLSPLNIWDCARRFTHDMYWGLQFDPDPFLCVSFHWSKRLGIQQGGAILHNDYSFDTWARKARFDGRTEGIAPKDDVITWPNWHMYMSPEIAAEGLVRLMHLPKDNPDLSNDDYPDLSTLEIFK